MTNEQTKQKMHPYSQVLQWVAEGKEIEAQHFASGEWIIVEHTTILKIAALGIEHPFYRPVDYRLKPERHIHQDLIDAYENGAKIQCWSTLELVWVNCFHPYWNTECKYRIKPEPKPDVVRYVHITEERSVDIASFFPSAWIGAVLEVTLDGETGEIKHSKKYEGLFNG